VEPRQQVAAVELQRGRAPPGVQLLLEGSRVAAQPAGSHPQFRPAAARHHALAELLPEEVHRLAQRVARRGRVQLGPEEGQEGVAAVEAARVRGGEPDEQGEPLRLLQDGPQLRAVRTVEVHAAEHAQVDHRGGWESRKGAGPIKPG
jgi:hypothetical protein